jgi:hypothetical protein
MPETDQQKFDRGLAILEMTKTEGWQILKKEIEQEIEIEVQEILDCEPDQFLQHREAIRAYKKILSKVETALTGKEEAAEAMRGK